MAIVIRAKAGRKTVFSVTPSWDTISVATKEKRPKHKTKTVPNCLPLNKLHSLQVDMAVGEKAGRSKSAKCQQHPVFPGGLPSKY